jgi:hypothetical protein
MTTSHPVAERQGGVWRELGWCPVSLRTHVTTWRACTPGTPISRRPVEGHARKQGRHFHLIKFSQAKALKGECI